MKKSNPTIKAQIVRSAFYLLLLLGICAIPFALAQRSFNGRTTPVMPSKQTQRTLSFADRVAYQRAIEDVYWRHRIWPKENAKPKPSLDEVMSAAQIEKKVEDYLRDSQALEVYSQKPIAPEQLQAEMERMARDTKQPEVLRELFEASGGNAAVTPDELHTPIPTTCTATSTTNAPDARFGHTAVWTGSEMIVWGGSNGSGSLNTGGRYNPSTDTWTATSTTNAPDARFFHTAVWTGSEMIVWGGFNGSSHFNTGGRYNSSTDTWSATSTPTAHLARFFHTAVWTGSEMIVWGGFNGSSYFNTGGRYNPSTDTWTATSTTNAPDARYLHTAVWTGSEMIVWGGYGATSGTYVKTGGRYNPTTNSWTTTNTSTAQPPRYYDQTGVWEGSRMNGWGRYNNS